MDYNIAIYKREKNITKVYIASQTWIFPQNDVPLLTIPLSFSLPVYCIMPSLSPLDLHCPSPFILPSKPQIFSTK